MEKLQLEGARYRIKELEEENNSIEERISAIKSATEAMQESHEVAMAEKRRVREHLVDNLINSFQDETAIQVARTLDTITAVNKTSLEAFERLLDADIVTLRHAAKDEVVELINEEFASRKRKLEKEFRDEVDSVTESLERAAQNKLAKRIAAIQARCAELEQAMA